MSLLSRMSAPQAAGELADMVAALLSSVAGPAQADPLPRRLPGPTGLGTSAARLPSATPAPVTRSATVTTWDGRPRLPAGPTRLGITPLVPGQRPAVSGPVPQLYCPPALRDNPALGETVNDALISWAEQIGLYPGRLKQVRAANFGRLIMLTHPDTDDPDRLLAAAKCALAEWSVDDHYVDDETAGADAAEVGARLAIAYAAADPAPLPAKYAPGLEQAISGDPVLAAIKSAVGHLDRYATPTQAARLRHEIADLWLGCNGETTWRTTGRIPPVWEYLANRSRNSFLPCIALIDPVGGYELPAEEYAQPRMRRAVTMAATAATLVNDLYSMATETSGAGPEINLPTVIAAEDHCSLREAIDRSVAIHDELVRTFETEAAVLSLVGTPQLRRFLPSVWAWLGGNREWHATSARYNPATSTRGVT
jgi:2-methylisoborneol synthase